MPGNGDDRTVVAVEFTPAAANEIAHRLKMIAADVLIRIRDRVPKGQLSIFDLPAKPE